MNGLREHLQTIREAAGPDLDILLDLNFNAKTEGYREILRAIKAELPDLHIHAFSPEEIAGMTSVQLAAETLARKGAA